MLITHKIALDPNNKQQTYFKKACGIARFTWNWALDAWDKQYQQHRADPSIKKPNALQLKKQFNAMKRGSFPWIYEVTKYASQQPFIHLQRAFRDFFTGKSKRPKFKKKGKSRDSFYVGGDQVVVKDRLVKIPNLGWVKLRESLRFNGSIVGMTISRQAHRWHASFHIDAEIQFQLCKNQAEVGVDLGINHLASLSTGVVFENERPLSNKLRRLKRTQRTLAQKQKGSKKYAKCRERLGRLHKKVVDKRQDMLHKLSGYLVQNFEHIVIEDLNVSGMMANHRLARAISDVGFYEVRRQLEYKSLWYGNTVVIANRFYPSSKTCSQCGSIKEDLSLKDRVFNCDACHHEQDRDLNAANNLKRLASTGSLSGIYALGQDGSVQTH